MDKIQNIEYFGYYFGEDLSFNEKFLSNVIKEFKRLKRKRIMENHQIKRIMRGRNYKTFRKFDADVGLAYSYNLYLFDENKTDDDIIIPLAHLNEEYCKSKIHTNNLEICYLNENIKRIQNELRERKKS